MTIINEGKTFQELNENIRIMKSQRSDTEKINLIDEGIKRNEFINNSLRFKIKRNVISLFKEQREYGKRKSRSFIN